MLHRKDAFKLKSEHVIPWTRRVFVLASPRPAHGRAMGAMGILGLALLLGPAARAQTILGSAGDYAVMAGSTVTINGTTTITGNLGAANIAGSGPSSLIGTAVVPITAQNQTDFTRAFNGLAAMTPTANLSTLTLGTSVGATILTPGVYKFDDVAALSGTLTLNALGQSNAVWVFQIGTTFDVAASSNVVITNAVGGSVANYGLFWQIGAAATVGVGATLEGNFLGGTTYTFGTGATISNGRALAGATGTIGLASNTIDFIAANSGYSGGLAFDGGGNVVAVPEPAATSVLIAGFMSLIVGVRRIQRHNN